MPPIVRAIILGVLQGATEFLPVSSSGHLVLVPWILGWEDPGIAYDALVHLATLLAVIAYFWQQIKELARGWWQNTFGGQKTTEGRLAWLILLSLLPGALMGLLLGSFFERLFASPAAVGGLLLVTGLLLYASERYQRGGKRLQDMSPCDALIIGLFQGCAIAPGISRSGATIAAGRFCGLDRDKAASFSFIAAIPLIAGAAGLQITKAVVERSALADPLFVAAGFVAAFVSGYLAIRLLLEYVRRHSLRPFAYYCWVIGVLTLLLCWIR